MDLRSRRPGDLNSIGQGREDSISQGREESIVSVDTDDAEPPQKRCRRTVAAYVRPGQRVYPQSAYFGSPTYERAMTAKTEREVLERYLAEEMGEMDEDGGDCTYFTSYVLDDFIFYRTPDIKSIPRYAAENEKASFERADKGTKGQGEFELPSAIYTTWGVYSLMFDGTLKAKEEEFLHRIPFAALSIGNIATLSEHNLNHSIWIQSSEGAKAPVHDGLWYELGRPAEEYKKHWEAFEWLALFVKYVSDALELCVQRKEKVGLSYFRREFAAEIRRLHGGDEVFERWILAFGKDDFRIPLATHVEFIWKQLHTAGSNGHLRKHLIQPLWGEILPSDLTAVPPAHPLHKSRDRCVVTSYVGSLFKWIFEEGIEVVEPCNNEGHGNDDEGDKIRFERMTLGLRQVKRLSEPRQYTFHHNDYGKAIYPRYTTGTAGPVKVGDVVELQKGGDTKWKNSTKSWYAYVRDTWTTPSGLGKIRILWLYWPEDMALCMSMRYPYQNELFFSDHCECERTIYLDEIVRKVAVEFFCIEAKPENTDAEFFVRQKYCSDADDINVTSLSPADMCTDTPCPCKRGIVLPVFEPNDFVLVREQNRLQPYQFKRYQDDRAWLSKLPRRLEVEGTGKVNELIWTSEEVEVLVRRIVRKCHVVKVQEGQEIPQVADWLGSSDWFFYRVGKFEGLGRIDELPGHGMQVDVSEFSTVSTSPEDPPLEIFDATFDTHLQLPKIDICNSEVSSQVGQEIGSTEQPLRGLDLFCGGGNFGRGVADGGAVHHKWAVDIDINAIHTYKANLEHEDVNLYFGSVNNFLFNVVTGRNRHLPKRGDIDFILAGSPCQGFSNANVTGHESLKSLSNSALVCTTISAIDFYRPKYAILENVPAMASTRNYRGQTVNVSNQIMCALIGMGYQCRCLLLDAWHFGAPQSRTRLFIEVAAPGCALPEIPYGSHAHPSYMKSRAVGKTAANIKFAERNLNTLTSFPPVKLEDSWGDLPKIGNGHLGVCIPYPDHKTFWTANARDRGLIAHIPHVESHNESRPARQGGYAEALQRGLIPDHLKLKKITPELDKRFTRIPGSGLAPTITCTVTPWSRICGRILHPCEDRVVTNMEAKRAQGFFDTDVLVGRPSHAFRIIGNSVCRQVAFALGGKLAEAVKKGPEGSGKGIVGKDLPSRRIETDKVKISEFPATLKSTNFMVLIKSRPKMAFAGDLERTESEDMDISRDSVGANFTSEERVNSSAGSVTSTPRKRIRIIVDESGEGSSL